MTLQLKRFLFILSASWALAACVVDVDREGTWLNRCRLGTFCDDGTVCCSGYCWRQKDLVGCVDHDGGVLGDGGPSADGGPPGDGGVPADGGSPGDGGVPADGGPSSDGGPPGDGGIPADGGVGVPALLTARVRPLAPNKLYLLFNRVMMASPPAGYAGFTVNNGGVQVTSVNRDDPGTYLVLTLQSPVKYGDNLQVSYATSQITAEDGAALQPFSNRSVDNLVPPVGMFIQVAAGKRHSCGLTGSGVAYCWGQDLYAQLGNGSNDLDQPSPVAVDMSFMDPDRFISLTAGARHSCGLTASGRAYCWGRDDEGQLGDSPSSVDRDIPAVVDMSAHGDAAFVSLNAGTDFTCGVTVTGAAYCWGYDYYGQLGDDSNLTQRNTPVPVLATPLSGSLFRGVSAGKNHTCATSASGRAFCWGEGTYGRLGADGGLNSKEPTPRQVDDSVLQGERFAGVQAGGVHSCGLTGTGRAYCWGYNASGELGDDNKPLTASLPSVVSLTYLGEDRFTTATLGGNHGCALTARGNGYCWGDDTNGQLGDDPSNTDQRMPVPIEAAPLSGQNFLQLSAGEDHTCGVAGTGLAYCWGSNSHGQAGSSAVDGGVPVPIAVEAPFLNGQRFVAISLGLNHSCALTDKGNPFCWGQDLDGQLGNGATTGDQPEPFAVNPAPFSGKPLVRLSSGASHTCGLTSNGTAYCWGDDAYGQLGNSGPLSDSAMPAAVTTSALGQDVFVHLAAGGEHTCGLTGKGDVYCWGQNENGQLGNSSMGMDQPAPTSVNLPSLDQGDRFVSLTAGWSHTCGVTNFGLAYCWGADDLGQLGNGTTSGNQHQPQLVDTTVLLGSQFTHIAAGDHHTCALDAAGRAYCWGRDKFGQLGDNHEKTDKPSPVSVDMAVLGGDRFVALSGGKEHTCGLTGSGRIYCWGLDDRGQLGDDVAMQDQPTPVKVTNRMLYDDRFKAVSAQGRHTCGLTSRGSLYCWGDGEHGQLGYGTSGINKPTPVLVKEP